MISYRDPIQVFVEVLPLGGNSNCLEDGISGGGISKASCISLDEGADPLPDNAYASD